MSYRDRERRLAQLEQAAVQADGEQSYVADIGSTIPRYWIDGREVGVDEFTQRMPDGPFSVDIGDDEE